MNGEGPNRLDSVKAGWVFNAYVYEHIPPGSPMYAAAETELKKVFLNPAFNLEQVKKKYQEGKGSNEILSIAFHGLEQYVLEWFRVGQTTMGLTAESVSLDDPSFDHAAEATLTNMVRVGLTEEQVLPVFKFIYEFRTKIGPKGLRNEAAQAMLKIDRFLQSSARDADRNAAGKRDEDIVEIKPSFLGVGLNVNALWRRIKRMI